MKSGWFQDFYERSEKSSYYKAKYDENSEKINKALSERLLFTQSNLRALIAQDTMGRLYFVSCPHKQDYELPALCMNQDQYTTACPGMFYQVNVTLLLGKMYYILRDEIGNYYHAANCESNTEYIDYFLPCTKTEYENISMQIVSIAPVLEEGARSALSPLPLPGPSGCLYALTIKNTGSGVFSGTVSLSLENRFAEPYELAGSAAEERTFSMEHQRVDKGLLMLYGEDGAAAVQMEEGIWNQEMVSERKIKLAPQEEITIISRIAVAEKKDDLNESLCILYRKNVDEWIGITSRFWKSRLGRLQVKAPDCSAILERHREVVIRSILDNFNCLQADRNGQLCVHWQGAPSHNLGRFWGIDFEPTAVSIMFIMPELGRMLLEYIISRNEPGYSKYEDHSTPILCAPLIIARKYYELTGDIKWIRERADLWEKLKEIYRKLVSFKASDSNLISSHFSSDGLVMNRYDNGTNVKIWYAIEGFARLAAILEDETAGESKEFSDKMKTDIQNLLEREGPFGRQIKGGINGRKNEKEDNRDTFYLNQDLCYYDGEDSASCMAPVYGIYPFDYAPWINYHRFARSLFASNYNPEMNTLRWFPYGGANDGTAYVSQLGGSVTRTEQKAGLVNMLECCVDNTGSIYWWPLGKNFVRRISRCSQGQGFLVWQYLQQWIGIFADIGNRSIRISPQGLPQEITWENGRVGSFVFDFSYREDEETTMVRLVNKGPWKWSVDIEFREYGSGAGAVAVEEKRWLDPYGTIEVKRKNISAVHQTEAEIERTECAAACGEKEHSLDHIGYHMPLYEIQDRPIITMQYVLYTKKEMEDVSITVKGASGWKFAEKTEGVWDDLGEMTNSELQVYRRNCQPWKRHVIPFWVELNEDEDHREVWFQRHPLAIWKQEDEDILYVQSLSQKQDEKLIVRLKWKECGIQLEEEKTVAIRYLTEEDLKIRVNKILGGRNVCD